jgi:hypothetical protein
VRQATASSHAKERAAEVLPSNAERTVYESLLRDASAWGPNEVKLRAGDVVEVLDEQPTMLALLYLVEHVPGKSVRFVELVSVAL